MLLTASRSVGMTSQVELMPSLVAVPRGLHRHTCALMLSPGS